eukprot:TRINITY_DN14313_c0_g1_i1.p1 TRINITY_DN14313_c0_g1~~TRINITY_DN14313_c0_g1_i1.p1  ORF type:complete len:316 (-),score=68.35 TRINITY_DN14313_c0_g1_i1:62-886(-)
MSPGGGGQASTSGLSRTSLSRSAPSLVQAAGFNLRDFSLGRKKIVPDRPSSASRNGPQPHLLGEIDLIGGNGRWRQRLAEQEFERRRIEAEERRAEEERQEKERRARQKRREERMRRQQEEEERQRLEEAERKRAIKEERERSAREAAERERLRREEEEREWQARQPKICEACDGSCICQTCQGKGVVFGMFLVPSIFSKQQQQQAGKDMGKLVQGCLACGGLWQGVRGEVAKGSGMCLPCAGYGKIWPTNTSPKHGARKTRINPGDFGIAGAE